jgi:predicted RNA-binding protein with PIN domain
MSKDLIVDGYNVLLRWRRGTLKRGPGNIERAREALAKWVARRVDDPSRVTLVFDAGRGNRAGLVESRLDGVRILFAEGLASADDWIARECDARRHDKNLVIISNDRAVQLAARQARVEFQSADQWIERLTSLGLHDEGFDEDPPTPVPAPPRTVDLTGTDLDEFREAMKQTGRDQPASKDSTSPPSVPDASIAPSKLPPPKADADLDPFYRDMRQWNDDHPPDPPKRR